MSLLQRELKILVFQTNGKTVGHPLIHLSYAFEMSSWELAMEALAMASASYSDIHKFIDEPDFSSASLGYQTSSPLEIVDRIHNDKRLDGVFKTPGGSNLDTIIKNYKDIVAEHWRSWNIVDPKEQFEESQRAATAIFISSTKKPNDFFLVHLLTTSHAIRILLPVIPAKFHISLVRQWFLLVVIVYIAQLRPKAQPELIEKHSLKGRNWDWVRAQAIRGEWADSSHYIKAIRALQETARTWGDSNEYYLKAAVKLIDQFNGWGGFGT